MTGLLGTTESRLASFILAHGPDPIESETGGVWQELARAIFWTIAARAIIWTERSRGATWSSTNMTPLVKRSTEFRFYTMDMSQMPEIAGGGDTVASLTSITAATSSPGATAADLTITDKSISGPNGAQCKIAGGTAGALYQLIFTVVTSNGYTLVAIGYLYIDDR